MKKRGYILSVAILLAIILTANIACAETTEIAALMDALNSNSHSSVGDIEIYGLEFPVYIVNYPDWITDYIALLHLDKEVFIDVFLARSTGLTADELRSLDDGQKNAVIEESILHMLASGEDASILLSDFTGNQNGESRGYGGAETAQSGAVVLPAYPQQRYDAALLDDYGIQITKYSLAALAGANAETMYASEDELYIVSSREQALQLYRFDRENQRWELVNSLRNTSGWPRITVSEDGVLLFSIFGIINADDQIIVPVSFIAPEDHYMLRASGFVDTGDSYLVSLMLEKADEGEGLEYAGVFRWDKAARTWQHFIDGLPDTARVNQMRTAKDGSVWIAATSGVYVLEGTIWKEVEKLKMEKPSWQYPRCLDFSYGADGQLQGLWVGIGRDIAYYDIATAALTRHDYLRERMHSTEYINYLPEEGLVVSSNWWDGHFIYDINNMDEPLLVVPGSGIGSAMLDGRFFLFGPDGYSGVHEADLDSLTYTVFNDGLSGFSGCYFAVVEDDVLKTIAGLTRVTLDYDTDELHLYPSVIMGEAFFVQKVGDTYYIHDYDTGLWKISDDFSTLTPLPADGDESYGGCAFRVTADGKTAWLLTAKGEQAILRYDIEKEKLYHVNDDVQVIYGQSYGFAMLEREDQAPIIMFNWRTGNDYRDPFRTEISYDGGKTFEVLTEKSKARDIFLVGQVLYYRTENGVGWIDVITKETSEAALQNVDGELAGVGGGYAALCSSQAVSIVCLDTGETIARFLPDPNSNYMSTSFVEGAFHILYTKNLYLLSFE